MASLRFQGVCKAYGDVSVLQAIDLAVDDGEFLVLVGPSGCGKSTLLRCIAGLEEVSGGEIWIGDRQVNDLAPRDRDVAMVFQSYALYPHMTVRENMGFALEVRKIPQDQIVQAVEDAADLLGLRDLLERRPAQLSGGQRQRVAMGRAIVRRPKVFLFDEPLSNLDASLRNQMRVELKRLHQTLGATMVYVTHDQVEALTLADRIMVLDGGVVQQVGSPGDLYDRPANHFVAGFIGAPAMNFLEAEGDGSALHLGGMTLASQRTGRVTVGVRPHDVVVGSGDGEAVIEVVEQLGWEVHLHMKMGEATLTARAEATATEGLGPGSAVSIHFAKHHLFDPQSGVAL